jgi:hypothetical protein
VQSSEQTCIIIGAIVGWIQHEHELVDVQHPILRSIAAVSTRLVASQL